MLPVFLTAVRYFYQKGNDDFGKPFMNVPLKPFLLLMMDNYTFQTVN